MYHSFKFRLSNTSSFDSSQFLKVRRHEFYQSVNATQLALKTGLEVPVPLNDGFRLGGSLIVGAKVSLTREAQLNIDCNMGTLFGIDDLILSSCCDPSFFSVVLDDEEPKEILIRQFPSDVEYRFLDYSFLMEQEGKLKKDYLTSQMPVSKSRLSQATLLSSISTQWTLLHEASHWLSGHCHITKNNSINESAHLLINFENLKSNQGISAEEKKCMELQADGIAFEILFHSLLNKIYPDPTWKEYGKDCKYDSMAIDVSIPESRIRALLVSSGCMVLLFEKMRSISVLSESHDYPRPLTRLLNLFATALRLVGTYSNTLSVKDNGRLVLSLEKYKNNIIQYKQLASGITMALHDLEILSDVLQINESIQKKNASDYSKACKLLSRGKVFLPDIASLMSGPSVSHEMKGENKLAMEEYIHLLAFKESLDEKLEDFALMEI